MEKISQQHIKWENTRAVFAAVAEAGTISRAELAARTGLSLMTIGKLVDALDACEVVTQEKDERILAGRTARLVACRPAWHMLVLDLTAKNFRMTVLDLSCKIVEEIIYPYDDNLFCEENLVLFLKNLPIYQMHQTNPAYCIGAGILLPGTYDAEHDRMLGAHLPLHVPLQPRNTLAPLLPAPKLTILSDVQAAAISASLGGDGANNLLWMSLERPISGALVLNNKPLLGARGCGGRFGEITVGTNFTLGEAMLTLTDPTERGVAVAIALYTLISALDPAVIRLEARTPIFDQTFLDALHGRLAQLNADRALPLPTIIAEVRDVCTPVLGIASAMREAWLHGRLDSLSRK